MGIPRSLKARDFYRAANQRFEDAEAILESLDRTTAAVYLAGYGVECILKALIIELTPPKKRDNVVRTFRGSKAHDFEWLKEQYAKVGGPPFPLEIQRAFSNVSTWTTDFRYKPGMIKQEDAEAFLISAKAILLWADGRL